MVNNNEHNFHDTGRTNCTILLNCDFKMPRMKFRLKMATEIMQLFFRGMLFALLFLIFFLA